MNDDISLTTPKQTVKNHEKYKFFDMVFKVFQTYAEHARYLYTEDNIFPLVLEALPW